MYRYYIGSINNIHGVPPVSWFLTSLVLAYIVQLLCKIKIHTGGHEKLIINTLEPYPIQVHGLTHRDFVDVYLCKIRMCSSGSPSTGQGDDENRLYKCMDSLFLTLTLSADYLVHSLSVFAVVQ